MHLIEPSPSTPSPPPWEVLVLVAPFLDPSTLAVASCVSKSWRAAASSPHLWLPLCLSRFPSSSLLLCSPSPSPRLLFSLLQSAASSPIRRRRSPPPFPRLSLRDLVFTIDVFLPRRAAPLLCGAKAGEAVETESSGVFRFDVDAAEAVAVERGDEMRVVWMAVRKEGWGSAFLVMEGHGKGRTVGDTGIWFEEELPASRCCSAAEDAGGMVAEAGLVIGVEGLRMVGKVSLGLMRQVGCRYVSVVDALMYLQRHLLPG